MMFFISFCHFVNNAYNLIFFYVYDLQNLVHNKLHSMFKHYSSKTVSTFLEENICIVNTCTVSHFCYTVI